MLRIRVPILVFFVGLALGVLGGCGRTAAEKEPEGSAAPFVPTPMEAVRTMLEMARVGEDDVVYDLGCGDGRIPVMAAEEFGARGVGVELRDDLIEEAWERARRAGVEDRVRFLRKDLFETDVSEATVVTLYLLPEANLRLRPLLLEQLKPGARIVSHSFDMGEWEADHWIWEEVRSLFLWIVPADIAGTWKWESEAEPLNQTYTLRVTQRFQELWPSLESEDGRHQLGEVTLSGDRLSLEFSEDIGGGEQTVRFEGVVRGDEIQGWAVLGENGDLNFPALLRRVEP